MGDRQHAERAAWDEAAQTHNVPLPLTIGADPWTTAMLAGLGDVAGARLLDCGCGIGRLSRGFADIGARIVGFDISEGQLGVARKAAEGTTGPSPGFLACLFEAMPVPDATFDGAVGLFVLHHVDLKDAAPELARAMKPGARGAFLETWQGNPMIRFAWKRLRGKFGVAMYGTYHERPLLDGDLDVLRAAGFDVRVEWPELMLFRMIDTYILRRKRIFRPVAALLERLDLLLSRSARMRRLGYFCVVHLRRRF